MQCCKKPWKVYKFSLLFRHRSVLAKYVRYTTAIYNWSIHIFCQNKYVRYLVWLAVITLLFRHHQDHFSVSDELRQNGHPQLASDLRIMWKAEKQSKDQRICIRLVQETCDFSTGIRCWSYSPDSLHRNVLRTIRDDMPGFRLLTRTIGTLFAHFDVRRSSFFICVFSLGLGVLTFYLMTDLPRCAGVCTVEVYASVYFWKDA